jgi:diguanylate cyclase (GGDEF)-like protein/PAS domain S-box-containing protein
VRTKTLLAACLALLLLMFGAFEVSRYVLGKSFSEIEADTARQSLRRVANALEADLGQIAISASDYAHWDDAYNFVSTRDPVFVTLNFSASSLDTLKVDFVWIVDEHGQDVFGLVKDPGSDRGVRPLDGQLLAQLRRTSPLITAPDLSPVSRLLRLPGGVLAFASAQILHNDQSGPSVGSLMFGRFLDTEDFARLEQTSQLPVRALPLGEHGAPATPLPTDVAEWLASAARGEGATSYLRLLESAETLDVYQLLRDVEQRPVLLLSTTVDRNVLRLGERTITWVIVALVSAMATVVLLMLTTLNKSWRTQQAIENRYLTIASQLDECILLVDSVNGEIFDANNATSRMLGYSKADLMTMRLRDVCVNPPTATELLGDRAGPAKGRELTLLDKDKRSIPVEVSATALSLERRALVCLVARDITARKEVEEQRRQNQKRLSRLALHDTLTRLPNRLHLRSRLPKLTAKADADGTALAMLFVDLDHFKDINDTLGHDAGDALLVSVAERLSASVAKHDLVVRMGGDEFVVVATGMRSTNDADVIARRIQDTLSKPFDIAGAVLNVGMSIGIAVYPDDGRDLEQLLKHADIALYQAKERGRGMHQFFTAEIGSRLNERLSLGQALRSAIGTDQIFLEYQPAFDVNTRTPVSVEALVRWRHPELGLIAPGRFIPIAEQTGLITELGSWVIRRVCRQLAEWQTLRVSLLPVSINVSARQFEQGRIAERVAELARDFDIDPRLLHFEITESVVVHSSEQHLGALQALRALGSKILIDDFGTGYSSLSYLKNLPIDTLKIDRSFVSDMPHDDYDVAIVRAVVGIARSLGLQLVAEGVETAEQLECLRGLGCETAQGFLFSRPLPAAECQQLLERHCPQRRGTEPRVRLLRTSPGSAA